jgi:hypothetical protein
VNQRFDEVYSAMGEGFAEHRQLLIDHIDGRIEQLGFALGGRIDEVRSDMGGRIDEVRSDMGGRIDQVRSDMRQDLEREVGTVRVEMRNGFDAVQTAINARAVETGTHFDRLESKLDAFIDAQAAVNRTLLERLDK